MRKVLIILISLLLTFCGCRPMPEKKELKPAVPEMEAVVIHDNTNIHYTGLYCNECHEKEPVEGGELFLKFSGDYRFLCRCHHGISPGYCHPLEITLKENEKLSMPEDLPLIEGNFNCNTCHDVYLQCRKSLFDRKSLRGGPYSRKTDFCYRCHEKEKFKKLNAHHQILAEGNLDVKMCLYCHKQKPDEKTATYEEVTFIGDIKALCRRCHQIAGNHAGNFDHMAQKPSPEGLKRMDRMKKKYDIILPLTEEGKMTCITCHNPHEKGVIQEDKPSAKGADSKYRHRLPGIMCRECHQM